MAGSETLAETATVAVVSQGNLQATQIAQSAVSMNLNMTSGVVQSGMPETGTMIATPGMSQQDQGTQSVAVNSNLDLEQILIAQNPELPGYVKLWEVTEGCIFIFQVSGIIY